MVVIVFGLPGSGKTYFATALAKAIHGEHYNTDGLRNTLNTFPDYSFEKRAEIYNLLLNKIKKNSLVVIDGTFYKKELRNLFTKKATEELEIIVFIEIKASEKVIKERVSHKRKDSDADFEVYQLLKLEFEEMEENHLVLYSDQMTLPEMISEAIHYIQNSQ